jgi:hypothetical protein
MGAWRFSSGAWRLSMPGWRFPRSIKVVISHVRLELLQYGWGILHIRLDILQSCMEILYVVLDIPHGGMEILHATEDSPWDFRDSNFDSPTVFCILHQS